VQGLIRTILHQLASLGLVDVKKGEKYVSCVGGSRASLLDPDLVSDETCCAAQFSVFDVSCHVLAGPLGFVRRVSYRVFSHLESSLMVV
jgi:hypothetical protein